MPTYEYACKACGHQLEAVQSFSDEALTECPECGSELRKVYGAPGIVLKGSGFYKTDSRVAAGAGNGSTADKKATEKKEGVSTESSGTGSSGPEASPKTGTSSTGSNGSGKDAKTATTTSS